MAAVRSAYVATQDARYLISILRGMSKNEILDALYRAHTPAWVVFAPLHAYTLHTTLCFFLSSLPFARIAGIGRQRGVTRDLYMLFAP